MSRLAALTLLAASVSAAGVNYAQSSPYTPQPGSAERKGIMDAGRIPIQKKLDKSEVVFKVRQLKVESGWAFMIAVPQLSDGSSAFKGTVYEGDQKAGVASDEVCVLLHRIAGKWRVVTYVIGPTDVAYEDWDRKYKAPSAIFR